MTGHSLTLLLAGAATPAVALLGRGGRVPPVAPMNTKVSPQECMGVLAARTHPSLVVSAQHAQMLHGCAGSMRTSISCRVSTACANTACIAVITGTWYVQRQIPALAVLESGGRNGVEQYDWDAAEERFSVLYTFNRRDALDDQLTTVRQRGWVASELGTRWEVAPLVAGLCPPLRLPFVIIDVEPASYMVCTGGLKSWMYVLTRERKPQSALMEQCLGTVKMAGFDMTKVESVEHTGS